MACPTSRRAADRCSIDEAVTHSQRVCPDCGGPLPTWEARVGVGMIGPGTVDTNLNARSSQRGCARTRLDSLQELVRTSAGSSTGSPLWERGLSLTGGSRAEKVNNNRDVYP
jgi:hypothetical protein